MKTNGASTLLEIHFAALRRDERAVSAVEFALVLPLMVAMYLGLSEITEGIGANRKVALTARALSDLTTRSTGRITNAEMNNIFDAAASVIAPYPTGPLKVAVTAINIDDTGKATVAWSETRGGSARAAGSSVSLPAGMTLLSTQLILSEVSYDYKPTVGYTITGTLTLSDKLYMSPRVNNISRIP